MNRRRILKCMTAPAAAAFLHRVAPLAWGADAAVEPARECTPALAAYQKLGLGVWFHFGMPTPMPWMHTWFWHPWYKMQSAEVLAHAYRDCMSGSANLLMNLAPDQTGRLPDDQMATLHRLAELIHE